MGETDVHDVNKTYYSSVASATGGAPPKRIPERRARSFCVLVYGADNGPKTRRKSEIKESAPHMSPPESNPTENYPLPGKEHTDKPVMAGLTIEIEDPSEWLLQEEQAVNAGIRRSETAESDIGLDPEEEELVGWSGKDLV